ncbi:hypothetical protein QQ045_016715 [Rhodiola kirilowii]
MKDCDNLIDRMTARLDCWSNKYLSRAGRRVLVSAVLQSMAFFWARGFGAKDIYNTLRAHTTKVDWHNLVWNDFNAPRDSFNAWLTVQDKLMTKGRMSQWSFTGARTCVLCKEADESRDHLFFLCRFAGAVWTEVLHFLKVEQAPSRWELLIPWFKRLPQKRLKTKLTAAACTRVMNVIWLARNAQIFKEEETSLIGLIRDNMWYLKMKIGAIKKEACDKEDIAWMTFMHFID